MTPRNHLNGQTNLSATNVASQNVFDAVQLDAVQLDEPEHLTFEELRELPMRLALSFDSSLDH